MAPIIDWDNLDLSKFTALELSYIRERSYYRYNPPNEHNLYAMLAAMLIVFSTMLYCLHMHWGIQISADEFPKFHKTQFWVGEFLAFFGGVAIIPFWWKKNKESNKNWKEMQEIRFRIDAEFFNLSNGNYD